ncbi:hypothetical protein D3C80_1851310 [compost metagenome]
MPGADQALVDGQPEHQLDHLQVLEQLADMGDAICATGHVGPEDQGHDVEALHQHLLAQGPLEVARHVPGEVGRQAGKVTGQFVDRQLVV